MANWRLIVVGCFLTAIALVGGIGTSTSSTFIWPVYGFFGLVAILSVGLILHESSFRLSKWVGLSVFTLIAYLIARVMGAPVAYFAREDAALVILAFLVYGLVLLLLNSVGSRRRLVELFALLVGLNLWFAFIQATVRPTLWIIPGYERTFVDRVGGLFNHPDHFSGFLAVFVPLWAGVAVFGRRTQAVRIGAAILGIVTAMIVLMSGSGAAIMAMVAGMGCFALLAGRIGFRRFPSSVRKSTVKVLTIVAIVAAVLGFAMRGPLARSLDRSLFTKGAELHLPLVWKAGWEQAMEAPLLGTGSRTSQIYGRRFHAEELNISETEPEFIHNEFLQMFADYGMIGLMLMLAMLGIHFWSGFRFVRAYAGFSAAPGERLPRSDHLALVLGALSMMGGLLVLASFDFVFHLPIFVVLGAALLGVLAAPDPMAAALRGEQRSTLLPGGALLFTNRGLVFGCGLGMTVLATIFSRSEYHYEMARLAFEADRSGYLHHPHLKAARTLDPKNPYVFTLSAHSQVAGILPEMAEPARKQALKQANLYFDHARKLYPQDVFSAIGHAAVLEELNEQAAALDRIREARKLAPHYGNLILAEAEFYLRQGNIYEAEHRFADALKAAAFCDPDAAQRGLMTVAEWKLIAEQNGVDWRVSPDPVESEPLLAKPSHSRMPEDAKIVERDLAGQLPPSTALPMSSPAPRDQEEAPEASGDASSATEQEN